MSSTNSNNCSKTIEIQNYVSKTLPFSELDEYKWTDGSEFGYKPIDTKIVLPIEKPSNPNKLEMRGDLFTKLHDEHAAVYYYGFGISETNNDKLYDYLMEQFNLENLGTDFKRFDWYIEYTNKFGKKCEIPIIKHIMMLPEEEHKIPVSEQNTIELIPFINYKVEEDPFNRYEIRFRVAN